MTNEKSRKTRADSFVKISETISSLVEFVLNGKTFLIKCFVVLLFLFFFFLFFSILKKNSRQIFNLRIKNQNEINVWEKILEEKILSNFRVARLMFELCNDYQFINEIFSFFYEFDFRITNKKKKKVQTVAFVQFVYKKKDKSLNSMSILCMFFSFSLQKWISKWTSIEWCYLLSSSW